MESQIRLSRRAYQLLQMIVGDTGPRPAGSEGEARFLKFAEGFFQDRGLATRRQAVPNVPSPTAMLPLFVTGIAGLLGVVWSLADDPWWIWFYIAMFGLLPKAISRIRRRMSGKKGATGHNLAADLPSHNAPTRRLILCAHHDTARASRIPNPKVGELAQNLMRLFPLIILSLGGLAVIRAVDLWVVPFAPYEVWIGIRAALMVLIGIWGLFILVYRFASISKRFSPGANDNGSGVAALMAVAEVLAGQPLERTGVVILFFSAEENGLLGSEQYVKEHRNSLNDATVLNLDMVGSGERITYVKGVGIFPPRWTTRRANALLRQVRPDIRGRWYWMGSSDFASFLAKKIPAASLEASGKGRENVYHTEQDTMDYIQPELLGEAAQVVLDFARALDAAAESP